VYTG
jgi:hypothetical protein